MIQPTTESESRSSGRRAQEASRATLTLFSYFWAAGTLFHFASFNQWRDPGLDVVAAFWVLLQPGSTLALVTFAAVQIYGAFTGAPYIPNHWLFAALVNATLIMSVILLALKQRRIRVDRGDLFDAFAPAVRLAVLVLYFFVVFHKLNSDWFDPRVSCGTMFYDAQAKRLAFLPVSTPFRAGAIYLSLAAEALIPLLLAFRRTRHAGIVFGAVFHWLLGLNPIKPFYNFSALLLPLFFLFAAPQFVGHWLDRLGERRLRRVSWVVAGLFIVCGLISHARFNQLSGGPDLFLLYWTAYGAILIAAFVALLRWRRPPQLARTRFFALPQPALAVLPVIVFLNGLTPYLGLKTEIAWAMFSNLKTEGGASNHLLVPAGLQVFDYQRDLVQITGSSSGYLRSRGGKQLVPYFEVRRVPRASISYIRAGVRHTFKRVADDPAFSRLPYLMAKFMLFRPIDTAPMQSCVH